MRKLTKKITVGNISIGGDSQITIQSMTNRETKNISEVIEQIKALESAGCQIIRTAIPDEDSALAIKIIKKEMNVPLVADIHFDYRLAILSIENGADKIRINPGNIGDSERIRKVVEKAKERNIPIRVGVNAGSLEKELLIKYNGITVDALVESAVKNIKLIEDIGYDNLILSIKASDVMSTIEAYRRISEISDYPLHIGITEAGTVHRGTIKSAVGIGTLLAEGIGDTLRVSLTGNPLNEVRIGLDILKSLGIRKDGLNLVSCPTCARCKVNLEEIANKIDNAVKNIDKNLKIAVMGCAVNGPGEAKDADIGVACGDKCGLIFIKGEIIKKVPEDKIVEEIITIINKC